MDNFYLKQLGLQKLFFCHFPYAKGGFILEIEITYIYMCSVYTHIIYIKKISEA